MEDNKKLAEMLKEIGDSLTDEQKEKAKACKTPQELLQLAGREGIELPDEVLDAVAGGLIYVNAGSKTPYEVYHDTTGELLGKADTLEAAKKLAGENGQVRTDTTSNFQLIQNIRNSHSMAGFGCFSL